jgi:hypothetical protein
MKSASKKRTKPKGNNGKVFRRYFKHYRTGKVYDAWKYGHKGWPIG